MEVQYKLAKDDLWRFQQFVAARRARLGFLTGRVWDYATLATWLVLVAILALRLYQFRWLFPLGYPAFRLFYQFNQHLVIVFIVCTALDLYVLGSRIKVTKALVTKSDCSSMRRSVIRPNGLHLLISEKRSFVPWNRMNEITSDGYNLYFFLDKRRAIIIPRRAFGTPETASAFLNTAMMYWSRALPGSGIDASQATAWPPAPYETPQPKVRIVSVPAGEAPEEVRRAWVGLILPVIEGIDGPVRTSQAAGVLSGIRMGLRQGYTVDREEAIRILGEASPEAAQWWRENHIPSPNVLGFMFGKDECEIVS